MMAFWACGVLLIGCPSGACSRRQAWVSASQMYEINLRGKAWHHKSEQTRQERATTCRLRDGHLVAAA